MLRSSGSVDVNNGLCKGFRSFLGQIVSDTSRDGPVPIFAREFLGVGPGVPLWCAIGITFERDCGHGDDRTRCKLLLQIVIFRLALNQSHPKTIVMDDDSNMIRVFKGGRGAIERGFVELANHAAVELMAPRDGTLIGNPIAAFLPDLHHALRWEEAPQFRATMQCRGHRGNGESFTADVWFSTYKEGARPKLAAIIADVTGEAIAVNSSALSSEHHERAALTDRESSVLRFVVQGLANKEIATRMEVSESTVKNTLQQLFAKTNVRTRAQLVREALEQYRDLL